MKAISWSTVAVATTNADTARVFLFHLHIQVHDQIRFTIWNNFLCFEVIKIVDPIKAPLEQ